MKKTTLSGLLLVISALFTLAGCGGNDGGTPPASSSQQIQFSGTVAAGLIVNGIVKVYAIHADGSRELLVSTTTDTNGTYTAAMGAYSGPVLVEASGSYTDEATGLVKVISPDVPLRAAVPNATGNVSVAVTPLTELAVVKAGPNALTAASIAAANKLISDVFKVDVIASQPVAPTASAMQASVVTDEQKDYTLALAAISQMMVNASITSMADFVSSMNSNITASGGMSNTASNDFQAGLATFLTSTARNQTGIQSVNETNLINAGGLTASYLLSAQSSGPSVTIYGIQLTITLPAGTSLRTDSAGNIVPFSFGLSGAAPVASLTDAKYTQSGAGTPATLVFGFANSVGFSSGEFAALTVDLAPGTSAPAAASFGLSNFKAINVDGANISGMSPVLTALP